MYDIIICVFFGIRIFCIIVGLLNENFYLGTSVCVDIYILILYVMLMSRFCWDIFEGMFFYNGNLEVRNILYI